MICEDLTKARYGLLQEVISKYGLSSVWTIDGIIYIKVDNTKHRITLQQILIPKLGVYITQIVKTSLFCFHLYIYIYIYRGKWVGMGHLSEYLNFNEKEMTYLLLLNHNIIFIY